MGYTATWAIILATAILGSVGLVFLTRPLAPSLFRRLLRILPGVLLVVPAPVPGYAGSFAPAFVVLIFEGLFQREGNPLGAVAILLTAASLTTLLAVFAGRFFGSAANAAESPEKESITD